MMDDRETIDDIGSSDHWVIKRPGHRVVENPISPIALDDPRNSISILITIPTAMLFD